MSVEELERRREAVRREIEVAFDGVTREGGVSWGEAYATIVEYRQEHPMEPLDEEEEEREPPHPFHDRDRDWRELVDDPEWRTSNGFSFLGPIGLRYYLPAAMMRSLRDIGDEEIAYPLTFRTYERELPGMAEGFREWFLEKWSALDDSQRRSVKNFLAYKLYVAQVALDAEWEELAILDEEIQATIRDIRLWPWKDAYQNYWAELDL